MLLFCVCVQIAGEHAAEVIHTGSTFLCTLFSVGDWMHLRKDLPLHCFLCSDFQLQQMTCHIVTHKNMRLVQVSLSWQFLETNNLSLLRMQHGIQSSCKCVLWLFLCQMCQTFSQRSWLQSRYPLVITWLNLADDWVLAKRKQTAITDSTGWIYFTEGIHHHLPLLWFQLLISFAVILRFMCSILQALLGDTFESAGVFLVWLSKPLLYLL